MAANSMFRINTQGPSPRMVDEYQRDVLQRLERASVRTVDTISRRGKSAIRQRMSGAGLGRLGNAIGSSADQQVVRRGREGFSASAQFFVRSRSERTLGALSAYTQGGEIGPRRGRWLWIPTNEIRRVAGAGTQRQRVTPGNWNALGLDKKIGPLVFVRARSGPLYIVPSVGVSLSGKKRSARSLTKSGRARKGDVEVGIVAFVGIPRTARAARINLTAILEQVRTEIPAIFAAEMAKEGR